ncbi:hypothetical protein ABZ553_05265 [Streptomyces sparsogenes]|uniref:hypothetical protein n=1 Tax=Streptomyces sparsogenes TaxID=67365 RepID=UPI0033EEB7F5
MRKSRTAGNGEILQQLVAAAGEGGCGGRQATGRRGDDGRQTQMDGAALDHRVPPAGRG